MQALSYDSGDADEDYEDPEVTELDDEATLEEEERRAREEAADADGDGRKNEVRCCSFLLVSAHPRQGTKLRDVKRVSEGTAAHRRSENCLYEPFLPSLLRACACISHYLGCQNTKPWKVATKPEADQECTFWVLSHAFVLCPPSSFVLKHPT